MTGIFQYGLVITALLLFEECWTIPLPGVKAHEDQNTDSSFFPYAYFGFQEENRIEPTFRHVVPNFNNYTIEQLKSLTASETKTTTTESPLEKLLDKLYGSNKWRSLLEQAGDNSPILATRLPLLDISTTDNSYAKQAAFQGLYGLQISGNQFNSLSSNQEITTQDMALNNPQHAKGSKFMMKTVGTRQHGSTDSAFVDPNIHGGHLPRLDAFSKDAGTPSMFQIEQDRGNQAAITMHPVMSVTQKPLESVDGLSGFDPDRMNNVGGSEPQYLAKTGVNNFNPNQVNNEQHLFRPNSGFSAFITQTGSDPSNHQLPVAYDADAINEHYMIENVNSLYQGQTGQASETVFGKEQYGYRFSAYGDAKPLAFNADALNQAMMESNRNIQQQPIGPMFPSASRVQQPTASSSAALTKVNSEKELSAIHKNDNASPLYPAPHVSVYTTTPKPPLRFGFVPGNLFPGQLFPVAEQQIAGVTRGASSPQFLHHLPVAPGNDAFNPDKINAAQNAYNPNAVSWLQTRDATQNFEVADDEKENSTSIMATTSPSYVSTTPRFLTTLSIGTDLTQNSTSKKTSEEKESTNASNTFTKTGFDPTFVNVNQGQTDFVPGQINPAYSGYMGHLYNQGQGQSYGNFLNEFNPNSFGDQGGAKMTFNIAKLLGINETGTGNATNLSYGQGTASFNPNEITTAFGGGNDNTTANTAGFAQGFVGARFDPNVANQGFANLLSSYAHEFSQGKTTTNQSSGHMVGSGGFDPNAANVGFGEGSFGMGNIDFSENGGFMTAYDPNKVNQMAMQNPFDQADNGTKNGGMTSYLLGIVPGNGIGQSSTYSSAYISTFNPDSVNKAPYNPNKYNQVHLHFDPLDMLSKNPGIEKDTLVAAASTFDPDKLNSPNMQQAFSPIAMLSPNPGIDTNVLSNLKYDPYTATSSSTNISTSTTGAAQVGKQNFESGSQLQARFDPVVLMANLMQKAGAFQPGVGGTDKQSLDPSSMFGDASGVLTTTTSSALRASSVSPSAQSITTSTTHVSSQSPVSLSSSTSPSVHSTSVASANDDTIG